MEYLIYSGMFVGVFVLAVGALIGTWAIYRYSSTRSDSHFVVLLLWLVGAGAIAVELFSTRSTSVAGTVVEGGGGLESSPTFIAAIGGKVIAILIVALATVRLYVGVIGSRRVVLKNSPSSDTDPAQALFFSYLVYFIFGSLLNSIAGTQPAFVHWVFYPALVLCAVYFSRSFTTLFLLEQSKIVLLILIYGSLASAVFFPSFAFESGYKGLIPGLTMRLYGLAGHPNSLGPAAVLFLVLEYLCPSSSRTRILHSFAAFGVLILAQSKTAYVAAVMVILIVGLYRISQEKKTNIPVVKIRLLATVSLFFSISGIGLFLIYLMDVGISINLFNYLGSKEINYLSTLTGRTMIWDITLKTWAENPLFGYGPTIWFPEFRAKYGLLVVGQAHNQFVQTLGESGVFGFIGLLIYFFMMIRVAFATSNETRGASLALVAIPLARTWTESPFRNFVLIDWAFFTHLLIFSMLVGFLREKSLIKIK